MNRKQIAWCLIPVVLGGVYFRLAGLGDAALRADSIELWRICQQPITGSVIFTNWFDLMGVTGQFPFQAAFTRWVLDVLSLPLNHFTFRFPSALWGILTIIAAYGLGKSVRDERAGLLLAALVASNPFHIQISREAYFYSPLVLGACLSAWGAVWAIRRWQEGAPKPLRHNLGFIALNISGFFLLTYSQPTGWALALACSATVMVLEVMRVTGIRRLDWAFTGMASGYIAVGLPLLLAPWALRQVLQISRAEAREVTELALVATTDTVWTMSYRTITSFAWGGTAWRASLSIVALVAGLYVVARHWKARKHQLFLPALITVGLLSFLHARAQAGALFETRYVLGLLPAYLALLTLGLLHLGEVLARLRPGCNQTLCYALVLGVGIVPGLYPAYLCTRQTGQPTPYKEIAKWFDTQMPEGIPVLVDRWFEPWNELRVYDSENVEFTFTIPNEPVNVFLQYDWRGTAESFFRANPDAAYLEIAKSYWNVPAVGPWEWPREYFTHSTSIVNHAGVKLRELGLANRSDYYGPYTNHVVVEIFYNTREDVLEKLKLSQVPYFTFYDEGWRYMKSGPFGFLELQSQQMVDWRAMKERAVLHVANLTDETARVVVRIQGVALDGTKSMVANDQFRMQFRPGTMEAWMIGPIDLPPGITEVTLRDQRGAQSRARLLVQSAVVQPVERESP